MATNATGSIIGAPPPIRILGVSNIIQRLVLLLWCVVALGVLANSRQRISITFATDVVAEFQDLPPLVYLISALAVTIFYCAISVFISMLFFKPGRHLALIYTLTTFDLLLLGILSAAAGAASTVIYSINESATLGFSICESFNRFCAHVIASNVFSLIASIQMVLLVLLNVVSLAKKIPY